MAADGKGAPAARQGHKAKLGGYTFAGWAHYMAEASVFLTIVQAFIALVQYNPDTGPGAYSIIMACVAWFIEWGTTRTKKVSEDEEIFSKMGWPSALRAPLNLFQNYYVRGVFYILMSIYMFLSVPLIVTGACWICTGIVYLVSALRKEKGDPVTGVPI